MTSFLLKVERLQGGYGKASVLRDVDITVGRGEVVALLGANGAGKTTLLRVVSGLLPATQGRVVFDGTAVTAGSASALARQGLAHVPEGRGIFFGLTVAEHFRMGSRRYRPNMRRAFEYFPALDSLRDRRAGLLSGGEQQMLALALALATKPKLLLLDELSLGLAPVIVEHLLPVVREVARDTGCGVLVVEQHVELALEIIDRGYVLSRGRIVLHKPVRELRADRQLLVASYMGERVASTEGGL